MSKITINPDDVTDLKSPLYRYDGGKVVRILPETSADQVKYANGQNGETVKSDIESSIASAQSTASTALSNAASAYNKAANAESAAGSAQTSANQALSVANQAKSQAETALTEIAGVEEDLETAQAEIVTAKTQADKGVSDAASANTKAQQAIDEKVSKSGDTMTGNLTIKPVNATIQPVLSLVRNINWADYTSFSSSLCAIKFKFADKDFSSLNIQHRPDAGLERWYISFLKEDGTPYSDISLGINTNKNNRRFMIIDTPELSDVSNTVTTCSWINQKFGTSASLTALADIDETVEDYVETLEIKKQKAIAQINAEAQQAIYSGFPYEIDGQEYFISYSLFDQANLNSDAVMAMSQPVDEAMSFRCMDETGNTVWLDVLPSVVLAIHKYGVSYRDMIRRAADEKKARIMTATSEDEIQAIYAE